MFDKVRLQHSQSSVNERFSPVNGVGTTEPIPLSAFNELVIEHQDAIYNFAYFLLGDPDLASDVTQTAFINAYRGLSKFRGGNFRSWLFRIVKNAAYDEFRRPEYKKTTSLELIEEESEWLIPSIGEHDPQQIMEQMDQSKLVHRAVLEVEEPFRTILVLIDIQELDYQEAANIVGAPVGTIKSRLARARQRLRAILLRMQS